MEDASNQPDPLDLLYKNNFISIHPDFWAKPNLRLVFEESGDKAHELGQMIRSGMVRKKWLAGSPKYKEIHLAMVKVVESGSSLTYHAVVRYLEFAGRHDHLKDHLEKIKKHCFGE